MSNRGEDEDEDAVEPTQVVTLNDILNVPRVRVIDEPVVTSDSSDDPSQTARRRATRREYFVATPSRSLDPRFLIVLDAENVALYHGKQLFFSVRGLEIVRDFFQSRGHRVIGFVPTYVMDDRNWRAKWQAIEKKLKSNVRPTKEDNYMKVPDDLPRLQRLVMEGFICHTPAGDYSDSYTIKYAMQNHGIVVTNDRYRDAIEKSSSTEERKRKELWIHTHLLSFAFVGDDFVPNPDFEPPEFDE